MVAIPFRGTFLIQGQTWFFCMQADPLQSEPQGNLVSISLYRRNTNYYYSVQRCIGKVNYMFRGDPRRCSELIVLAGFPSIPESGRSSGKGAASHSVFLPQEFHGQRSLSHQVISSQQLMALIFFPVQPEAVLLTHQL